MSLNISVAIGRLTKDPEKRYTNSGTAVTSFNLAVNRDYKTADNQEADFIPCVCWGKTAENVEKYCSKGSLISIHGRLCSRSYDNAQGQKVFVLEVNCERVQFLDHKKEQPQQTTAQNDFYNNVQANTKEDNSFNSFDIQEEDIQF